uniref:Uncharacterized protein n=1 Tax=Glossina pallidipes TaxID=7398 RepID=A0A1A9ZGR3_GLOPL
MLLHVDAGIVAERFKLSKDDHIRSPSICVDERNFTTIPSGKGRQRLNQLKDAIDHPLYLLHECRHSVKPRLTRMFPTAYYAMSVSGFGHRSRTGSWMHAFSPHQPPLASPMCAAEILKCLTMAISKQFLLKAHSHYCAYLLYRLSRFDMMMTVYLHRCSGAAALYCVQ